MNLPFTSGHSCPSRAQHVHVFVFAFALAFVCFSVLYLMHRYRLSVYTHVLFYDHGLPCIFGPIHVSSDVKTPKP